MTLTAFVAIYFVHLAAVMAPGPTVLLAARTALRDGMASGLYLSLGFGVGAVIWALAALFGLAILFQVAPTFLILLKILGGGYLLYLAYTLWKHAPDPISTTQGAAKAGLSQFGLFRLGLMTMLANPKTAVFFGTVFLTFMPADAPAWAYAAVLSIVFINDFVWNIIVTRIFSLERTRRAYMSLKSVFDRIFGALLAALSLKLVFS